MTIERKSPSAHTEGPNPNTSKAKATLTPETSARSYSAGERPLNVARAPKKDATVYRRGRTTWAEVLEGVRAPLLAVPELEVGDTEEDTKAAWAKAKESGGLVFYGRLDASRRKTNGSVESRSLLVLDADHVDALDLPDRVRQLGVAAAVYATHSHTPEAPRWRVLVLPDRDLTRDEYALALRTLEHKLGLLGQFDKALEKWSQAIFAPATADPEEYARQLAIVDGPPVQVADLLELGDLLGLAQELPEAGAEDATPRAPYDGPAYAEMTPDRRRQIDTFVQDREAQWEFTLGAAEHWDDGEKDHKERGWEALVRDAAMAFAGHGVAAWAPGTVADARKRFFAALPEGIAEDEKCKPALKWKSAVRKAEREPLPPPAGPAEDFTEPLPPLPPGADPSSWLANGLTAEFWTDTSKPEPPEVLAIEGTEGAMFGKGRVSRLFGLSGSAKSWAAKAAVLERLHAGESVLYLDADGIKHEFRDHMRLLGLTDAEAVAAIMSGRLHYVRVEGSLVAVEARALLKRGWGLVVLDGFNNALTASAPTGRSGLDATEVNMFFQGVLWPAAEAGAAVVVIDHMRKDGDADHGSVQKRNNLTGTDYAIKRVSMIAPGVAGYSEVRLTHKDRSGWATSVHAKRGKDANDAFVYVVVDSREEGETRVRVVPDLPSDLRPAKAGDDDLKDARVLLALIRAVPEGFESNRKVVDALKERGQSMDNGRINAAADLLVDCGMATRGAGKAGALTLCAVPGNKDEL